MKKVDKSETATLSQRTGDLIIAKKELAYQTKGELIKELHKLHQEYASLKTSYEKDISKIKQTGVVQRDSSELLKYLIDSMLDGVSILDVNAVQLDVNPSFCRMTGFSKQELVGAGLPHPYWPPEKYAEIERSFQKTLRGDFEHLELTFLRKNGERFPVIVSPAYIKDSLGRIIGYIATIKEITERKQAEEELRFQANLLENVSEAIIATDMQYNIKFWNKAAEYLYGWTASEVIGHPFEMFIINDYLETSLDVILHKISQDGYWKGEVTQNRRDGVRINIISSLSILTNDINQKSGFISVNRDITEQKKVEEEIRKSKKLLEDLYKHQIDIREHERASISREIHDELGQSMTALKLDLKQMHKYVCANPEAIMKLDIIIELVSNTIKDVQRISSDLLPGILDDLGLVSAIEWYCDEFEKRTGIKCFQKLENSDYSDSIINLTFFRTLQESLTNVIRHAKASSVNVKLHLTQKGTVLTIKDNGIGIPEEKTESHKSLGLLGMCERVRQLNGRIDISSEKGEGTKITVLIPSK